MAEKYNMKNPSVKRILQEVKEMQANPSEDFMSLPLEENIFEWQFAIRGPRDTEFEGGIYHGRIQLPAEYPFKPPSFLLLTPNGRFETQTKICLSISNYHPEHWQPSWSVRTALVALIAFMPTSPGGAIGSLDYSKEERKKLAIKSRIEAPKFGTPDRQHLIDQIHEYMLSKSPSMPQLTQTANNEAPPTTGSTEEPESKPQPTAPMNDAPNPESDQVSPVENVHEAHVNAEAGPVRAGVSAEMRVPRSETGQVVQRIQQPNNDRLFSVAAFGLTIAILVLVMKKFLRSYGYPSFMESL